MRWHTTQHSYSRWRTEQFDIWHIFLSQHIRELQTSRTVQFFTHHVYVTSQRCSDSPIVAKFRVVPEIKSDFACLYRAHRKSPRNPLKLGFLGGMAFYCFGDKRGFSPPFCACLAEGAKNLRGASPESTSIRKISSQSVPICRSYFRKWFRATQVCLPHIIKCNSDIAIAVLQIIVLKCNISMVVTRDSRVFKDR